MLLLEMFLAFVQVGLFSVGGGYAAVGLIREQIVENHALLTMAEFSDLITVAEMTPGPIAVNAATFVGVRIAGPLGAVICTFGVILLPCVICLILAGIYYKYRSVSGVQRVLGALRPAVVALIGSAALSLLCLALFNANSPAEVKLGEIRPVELCLFVITLVLLQKKKLSPIAAILLSGLAGTVIYLLLGALA